MFVLRSLFWLTTIALLLPPSGDGEPAPRVSFVQAAYAARILVQDMTGVCARHPEACATSRETLALMTERLEAAAGVVAGIAVDQGASLMSADRGTLEPADLEPAWSLEEPEAHAAF